MLPHTLFHPVVTFILVNLLAVTLRSDLAAELGPSALYLLVRIQLQFRLRGIVAIVVHTPLAFVVAFLFVHVLPSSRHVHHAAVLPKLAMHQFFGIAADRCGCETFTDIVYILELVLVNAIVLVNGASPRHRSYPATCCRVGALYQIVVAVRKISRHMFFLQVRSKLTPEIIISTLVLISTRSLYATNEDYKFMTTIRTKFLSYLDS